MNRAVLARVGKDAAGRKVASVTRRTRNRAVILAPVDTGNLRAAHTMQIRELARSVHGRVMNRIQYALPVHDGRGVVVIRPKRRKALRFVVNGRVVFARKVVQPPRRGKPWLYRALQEVAIPEGFTVTRGRR